MLVLSRKVGESICIAGNIVVTVSRIDGNRVSLALAAPREVHIVRQELTPFVDEFRAPPRLALSGPRQAPLAGHLRCRHRGTSGVGGVEAPVTSQT